MAAEAARKHGNRGKSKGRSGREQSKKWSRDRASKKRPRDRDQRMYRSSNASTSAAAPPMIGSHSSSCTARSAAWHARRLRYYEG